jgi:hypothetical protein
MDSEERESTRFVAAFLLGAIGLIFRFHSSPWRSSPSWRRRRQVTSLEVAVGLPSRAPPGAGRDVVATNEGSAEHNLTLEGGPTTGTIASGATGQVDLGELAAGSYTLICTIPGHAEAGMKTTLTVTDAASGGTDHGTHDTTSDAPDYAAMDAAMEASILAFPAKTTGAGNQPLQPKILADGTKEFALTASIGDWEVEPGRIVQAWAYNGQVPGPEIRVDVGDKVRVLLTNNLPMGTDVHHHGVDLPFAMDGVAPITQKVIEPGETFVYEFTATRPAVAMYHAHHMGQMQVTNGLFGAFYVGEMPLPTGRTISGTTIPENLTIAQQITMVLNDAGVIGFSLNEVLPATATAKVGDWIEVSYFNEGLQIHPIPGTEFRSS